MAPECITSRDNSRVKYACKLAQSAAFRSGEGAFFAQGAKLCEELAKGCTPSMVLYTQAALHKHPQLQNMGGEHFVVQPHVAEKLTSLQTKQEVFAVFQKPAHTFAQLPPNGRFLALERVQDPGNVGALVRSAAAFGFDAVVLGEGCADPFAPKTLRASMGAVGRIALVEVPNLADAVSQLASQGVFCIAAALQNSRPLSECAQQYPKGICLCIGSEGQGLSGALVQRCNTAVRIPISDAVESLNASVAGSVLLWQFRSDAL